MVHRTQKGFTLIELIITACVVVIIALSLMYGTTQVIYTSQAAYQRSIAMQDANRVMEDIRELAATGTFPGNVTGTYANGSTVTMTNLPSEVITINYANSTANPLDVTITVSYTENSVRAMTAALRSYVTQRA